MKKLKVIILVNTLTGFMFLLGACTNDNTTEKNISKNNINQEITKKSKETFNVEENNMTTETTNNIVTTDSGLKYEILTAGTSEQTPEKGKSVTVHYTGWLEENGTTGKKFDSSVDRGQPFSFVLGVGMVIRGWDEGVATMKIGEKRRLTIPANLGYGAQGAGNAIPGNATLIFDVELLKIG